MTATSTSAVLSACVAGPLIVLGLPGYAIGKRRFSAVGSVVRHLVDADRDREDQGVVLAGSDLDAVGVADAEPALRHLGHGVAATLDLVLVVDDVPLRLQVLAAFDRDREPLAERRDQSLLDRRHGLAAALDPHRVPDLQELLLDLVELGAGGIQEREGVP